MSTSQTPSSASIAAKQSDNNTLNDSANGQRNGSPNTGLDNTSGVSARGGAPVSMAKGHVSTGQNPSQAINFGNVHDQNATAFSSSPAAPAQLQNGPPTKFGTVAAADVKAKEKVVGFPGAKGESTPSPAPRSMDFNKLFQAGGGNSSSNSNKTAATANTANAQTSSQSLSTNQESNLPPSPSVTRSNQNAMRPNNRVSSHSGQVPGAQGQGVNNSTPRINSGNYGAHQQPRSPHVAGAQVPNMQHMGHMNGNAQWQNQQQQQMYYPQMYHQPYGYAGMPQQMQHMGQPWMNPQNTGSYDSSQGQPRSPRNPSATSASQNGGSGAPASTTPGTPSVSSATVGVSSPASSHRSIPHTPSNLTSPPPHHIGMGHPQNRPQTFQTPSNGPGFNAHSPSHSFSANSMSAAARQFEPGQAVQKRMSSAIRIVDPNTKAAVEFKSTPKKDAPSTPGTPVAAPATPSTPNVAPVTSSAAAPSIPPPVVSTGSPAPPARKTGVPITPSSASSFVTQTPPSSAKLETSDDFMKKVRAKAEEAKRLKEEKAREEAEKKAKEDGEKPQTEKSQVIAPVVPEVKPTAEAESKTAPLESQDQAKKTETDATKTALETATSTTDESANVSQTKPDPPTISTPFKGSAADVERMAREVSSVPSTPMEGSAPRLPPTPRTPGTPGFANLPAKPMSSMGNTATPNNIATLTPGTAATTFAAVSGSSNGIKLDSEALEKRKKAAPSQLDIASAQNERTTSTDVPMSAASAALGSARFIDDFSKVSYPDKIQSPRAGLNETAEPGKFRYDRDFLLQFMGVYKERPNDLPSLASIGMDSSQAAPSRGQPGRRASGMGPPAAPGRSGSVGLGLGSGFGGGKGGMGQFSHPGKTSEERFAASNRGGAGSFGSSGPMGAFSAGARSQPLSRAGSGSNAIPSREAMGTGVPSGGRTSSRRGKDRRDPGRSGVNPPEKGGPTIPEDQVVPLANSENRWTGNRGTSLKADSPELVTRKVKSLLNKLTMERFDSISMQILEWANKSVDETDGQTLRIVIAMIFEKATDEAAWSEMYATLCRKIMEKLDPNIQDENIKTNDDKPVMGGHLFRKYLVNRCQEDFERGWAQRDATAAAAKNKEAEDLAKKAQNEKAAAEAKEAEERGEKTEEPKEAELLSDEYYEAQKAKRRGLGLVRFIGELFKFSMLTEKIMHLCIQKMLSNATTPEEEEIESLCKLLTTVGKLLDEGKARNYVDVYFERMNSMMSHASMTPRMKFMLQDVIELRQSNWKPRHNNAAPKTIAQIHEDAAKAKRQAELESSRMQMGGSMSRGGSRRGQQREQYGADGFITVGNQPAPPVHQSKAGNLSAFGKGIDRSGSHRPLSVGPQSVFARKNQKSDDGSNPPSRTASSQNIFSLLSGAGDGSDVVQTEEAAAPSGRPKLNLAKRTKPLPGSDENEKDGEDAGKEEADVEDEDDEDEDEDGQAEETELSEEDAKRKIDNDIKEFLEVKDISEGELAMQGLPSSSRSQFINKIVEVVLNRKEDEVKLVGKLFEKAHQSGLLDDTMVETGLKDHVEYLDDISIDVPSAYSFMAILLVSSGLSKDKIESLASTIQGEGLKPPKDRLMAKVEELL